MINPIYLYFMKTFLIEEMGEKYEILRFRPGKIYIMNDDGNNYWYDSYRFCWK